MRLLSVKFEVNLTYDSADHLHILLSILVLLLLLYSSKILKGNTRT